MRFDIKHLAHSVSVVAPSLHRPGCPICLLDWSEEHGLAVITRCNHVFHGQCLVDMFISGAAQLQKQPQQTLNFDKCPVCRGQLITEELCRAKDHSAMCQYTGSTDRDSWASQGVDLDPLEMRRDPMPALLGHAVYVIQRDVSKRLDFVRRSITRQSVNQLIDMLGAFSAVGLAMFHESFPGLAPYVRDSTISCHVTGIVLKGLSTHMSILQWVASCVLYRHFYTESLEHEKAEHLRLFQRSYTRSQKFHIPTLLGRREPRFTIFASWSQSDEDETPQAILADEPYCNFYYRMGQGGRCIVSVVNFSYIHITEIGSGAVTDVEILDSQQKIIVHADKRAYIMQFGFEGEMYLGPMVRASFTAQI